MPNTKVDSIDTGNGVLDLSLPVDAEVSIKKLTITTPAQSGCGQWVFECDSQGQPIIHTGNILGQKLGVVGDLGWVFSASTPVIFGGPVLMSSTVAIGGNALTLTNDVGCECRVIFACTEGNGTITLSGGEVTANSFNATSDIRLKENIEDTKLNFGTLLDNLHIVDFNFKADPDKTINVGLIAQELQELLPERYRDGIVTEVTKPGTDETYLAINESKLIYIALLALREQKQKIAILNSRISALENKD